MRKQFTKAEVDYSEGMLQAHCGICEHFRRPGSCTIVEGTISARMWCKKFERSVRDTIKSAAKGH